jgi:protein gp37
MSETSKIEWTDGTWNPWYGCIEVSPGCDNCYAHSWAKRSGRQWQFTKAAPPTFLAPTRWEMIGDPGLASSRRLTHDWRPAGIGEEVHRLDWVIVGCESGSARRPFDVQAAAQAVHQCKDAGVAAFVKQVIVDGQVSHNMSRWPVDLQVRQFPVVPRG